MVNKVLVEYLRKYSAMGYPMSSLRKALINQNYNKVNIEEAIEFVTTGKIIEEKPVKIPLGLDLSQIPPEIRNKKVFRSWLKDKIKQSYDVKFIIKKLKEYNYNLNLVDRFLETQRKYGLEKEIKKLRKTISDKEYKEKRAFYLEWLISLAIMIIAFVFSANQMLKIQSEYMEVTFFKTMGFWLWIVSVAGMGIVTYISIIFIKLILKRRKEVPKKTSKQVSKQTQKKTSKPVKK